LQSLSEALAEIENRRARAIEQSDANAAELNRDAAQAAVTELVVFLESCGIDSRPLALLLSELVALTGGSSSRMFTPAASRHRRSDPAMIEGMKGRLAAIMEYRQQAGLSRREAGEWVVRHIPDAIKRRLGSPTRATIDSWLVKWGGSRGFTRSAGREGYEAMWTILKARKPSERQLIRVMIGMEKMLPA
jgi:hypothetical protein